MGWVQPVDGGSICGERGTSVECVGSVWKQSKEVVYGGTSRKWCVKVVCESSVLK